MKYHDLVHSLAKKQTISLSNPMKIAKETIDISPYQFHDLVDVAAFTRILENFFKATLIPNGLVATDGQILCQSGWENACSQFHRVHQQTAKHCVDSNLELMQGLKHGETCGKLCGNGLLDYATPIEIEGKQIATLFLGQILHSPPNLDFFRKQAKQFGFDEAEYIESIRNIPIVDKAHIDSLMACIVDMAQMLALNGLTILRQTQMEQDISKHKERQIQLEDILDSSPVAIGWSNSVSHKIEYVNRSFQQLFGYTLNDIPDLNSWYKLAYPNKEFRENVIFPWYQKVALAKQTGVKPPDLEATITCKDGSTRRVLIHVSWVGQRRLINFSDITEHWLTEQRMQAHDAMLEMVATGKSLTTILDAIVNQIQSEDKEYLCNILLLDGEGKHLLVNASSPDLPDFFIQAINGKEVGYCSTSAYLEERIITEDVLNHESWKPYSHIAKQAGIQACWSEPIINSRGKILGTFSIYRHKKAIPSQRDIELMIFAANLASIAIESHQTHQELERRAYYDYLTKLSNRRYFLKLANNELIRLSRYGNKLSVLMMDVDHFKQVNDTYGHNVGDIVLRELAHVATNTLRNVDILGRIGGEEFAILLPETSEEQAIETAERLRETLACIEIPTPKGHALHFTVSLGITSVVANTKDKELNIDVLLNQADKALYKAKNNGRNQVCVFATDTTSDTI